MQKILFGIFAHPDDEAFATAATLLKETREGTELHLIALTAGEHGPDPDHHGENLGKIRLEEWRIAGKLLGATAMHHLGYEDGTLNNGDHVAITNEIEAIVKKTVAARENYELEFISLDTNGYTGHIDHIVAARSALLAFYRLRKQGLPMKRVRLGCFAREDMPKKDLGFVLMEEGRTVDEINDIVDERQNIEDVKEVMRAHYTQRGDYETALKHLGDRVAVNHFIVKD